MAGWSYSTGERGRNRVRAYEQARDGRLRLEWREAGRRATVALPTPDRETAKRKADELAARLRQPDAGCAERLTLRELFDIYGAEVTPLKGAGKQGHDKRAARYFLDILGPARLVHSLTHRDAARFAAERRRRGDQRRGNADARPMEREPSSTISGTCGVCCGGPLAPATWTATLWTGSASRLSPTRGARC